jgi:hypothetical protein
MITDVHLREIDDSLSGWLRRLRLREAMQWAVRGLAVGLAAGLGLSLVGRLAPWQPLPVLIALSVTLAILGALLALVIAYFWPRPRLAAARYFDRVLGLAERTSAALELAQQPERAPEWLTREQWADAAQASRNAAVRQRLPLWAVSRRDGLLVLVLLAVLTASLALPNPQEAVLAQQQLVQQAIAQQAEQIESLIEQIENNPNLTEAQKEELTKPLEEARQQLQQPNLTEEQAQQALAEAQQELRELQDPNAEAQVQNLQQAGEGLSQNATTEQAGEALQNGDLQQAGEALANIDPSTLSEAERQALADQLDQTAEQLEETNPETAQAMREAAEALRNGDTEAAREALERAGESVAQAGERAEQSQAARQASGQVQRAQQGIAQAGQTGQGQNGQGQNGQGQNGQGQQGQGGQGQQGNGGQNGQGQGSSGAGTGEGNGQAQGGQAGGQVGQNNGPGDGGERAYEPIYSPYRLGGSGGPDATLPNQGNGDPGDDVVGQGPTNPQNSGEVRVPYNRVFNDYRDNAYSAIDQGDYPPELRDVVKDYFSSLEP